MSNFDTPEVLPSLETPSANGGFEAGVNAAVAREQYEIQAAAVMAAKRPRNEAQAMVNLVNTYKRPKVAEKATYSFERAGKEIFGPSVNLSRQAVRCWGNLRTGFVTVSVDKEYVHLRGYALDLETNSRFEQEDKFAKKIQRKVKVGNDYVTRWIDPDEKQLQELINKRGAILERNCSLRVLPPDLIEDAIEEAKKTLRAAAGKTLKANRDDAIKVLIKAFAEVQVSVEMLESYLGHEVKLINDEEYARLRSICVSIHEGNNSREDVFKIAKPPEEDPELSDTLKNDLSKVGKNEGENSGVDAADRKTRGSLQDSKVPKP